MVRHGLPLTGPGSHRHTFGQTTAREPTGPTALIRPAHGDGHRPGRVDDTPGRVRGSSWHRPPYGVTGESALDVVPLLRARAAPRRREKRGAVGSGPAALVSAGRRSGLRRG